LVSSCYVLYGFFFFFQAEDGIRDFHVTGVQTCALPISQQMGVELVEAADLVVRDDFVHMRTTSGLARVDVIYRRVGDDYLDPKRSEERRVGKECRSRW